jgi:hypothetical protein
MKRSISCSLTVCILLLALQPGAQSFTVDYYSSLMVKTPSHKLKPALSLKAVVGRDEIGTSNSAGRRHAFSVIAAGSLSLLVPFFVMNGAANALDMDAFINRELESDTKNCNPKKDPKCMPKLSADEALCQYGQSGEKRSEACKRVRAAGGSLPDPAASQGKSLGGAYAM